MVEAVPAARLKSGLDVTGENWFLNALEKTENQHFSYPHVQYVFDSNENQYRWVISLSRAVELTEGTSTTQGVLLVDLSYSSLEHLFDGVTTGKGGYVYLISNDGRSCTIPRSSSSIPAGCRRTIWWLPAIKMETTGRIFRGRPGTLR